MDPQKAADMGVRPDEVAIECWGGKYAGHWILHVPALKDDERGLAILTSTPDIYLACHWVAVLKRIVNGS